MKSPSEVITNAAATKTSTSQLPTANQTPHDTRAAP